MNRHLASASRFSLYLFAVSLPLSTTLMQIALALLAACLAAQLATGRRPLPPRDLVGGLILAMVAWVLLAAPFSLDWSATLPRLGKYWIWLTYFGVLAALSDRRTATRALWLMLGSMGLVALYGIAQHFFGDDVPRILTPPVKLWQKTGGYYHAVGMFDHHLTYGNSLILALLLGVGLWFETRSWRWRAVLASILFVGLLALLWSYARSAWVGMLAGLLVIGGLKGKRALIGALVAVALVVLVAAQVSPTIKDRLRRGLTSQQNLERIYTFKTTADMIRDHPLTGIGPGNYQPLTERYRAGYNIHWTARSHAHNSYLQIAAESGIVAGLLFTALLAVLFAFGVARHRDIKGQAAARDLLAGTVGAVVAFAFSSLLQHNAGDAEVCMLFQFAAALLVFLAREKAGDGHGVE